MRRTTFAVSLVVSSAALAACSVAEDLPTEADARKHFESSRQEGLASGEFRLIAFRKLDGKRMEMHGVPMYLLKYEAILEWPNGKMCTLGAWASGCHTRKTGERQTITKAMTFERTENGWNVK
jgi:hypothetical protein